jgi:hypothetical protein
MRKRFFLYCSFIIFITSCKSSDKQTTSESNIDAARNFIRAALDGKFSDARTFMLQDSVNTNYMDLAERSYKNIDQATKDGYRASSINIHLLDPVNDSTAIVIYSNSFKNDHDTLKVLKSNDNWLVDFKYLYQHDADSSLQKPILKDTLK